MPEPLTGHGVYETERDRLSSHSAANERRFKDTTARYFTVSDPPYSKEMFRNARPPYFATPFLRARPPNKAFCVRDPLTRQNDSDAERGPPAERVHSA